MTDDKQPKQTTPLSDLKPGDSLEGTIKKIELYGAFVDVGAERDGLVHISMLQRGKVNRVEDVVSDGQQVTVWVKSVDANSGRLELTMIEPLALPWKEIQPGLRLRGKVVRLETFGAFVEVGAERPGLVHISELSTDYVAKASDVVKVDDEIDVVVLDVDRKKRQIRLSVKALEVEEIEEEEEAEEEHTPTAMEVALRKALGESAGEAGEDADPNRGGRKEQERQSQEDILARTLSQRVRTSTRTEGD